MTGLDYFLLLSLAGFVWAGFGAGLIQSIGALVGVFLGATLASRWYDDVAPRVAAFVGGNELVASIVAFLLLFIAISRGSGLVFLVVNKLFNIVAIVPGMKLANRLGGAVLGAVEGVLTIGLSLQVISRFPLSGPVADGLTGASTVPFFLSVSSWLLGLLPDILRNVQSVIR